MGSSDGLLAATDWDDDMTDFLHRIDPLCSCGHSRSSHHQGNDGFAADCAVFAHGTKCACSRFGVTGEAVNQSDDLRTRIAAVLAEADGMPWKMWSKPSRDGYLLRADAIIRELEADYVLVPKSHTLVRMGRQALFGQHLAVGDNGPIMLNISSRDNDE